MEFIKGYMGIGKILGDSRNKGWREVAGKLKNIVDAPFVRFNMLPQCLQGISILTLGDKYYLRAVHVNKQRHIVVAAGT